MLVELKDNETLKISGYVGTWKLSIWGDGTATLYPSEEAEPIAISMRLGPEPVKGAAIAFAQALADGKAIDAIKILRADGMNGLKEAKELYDDARYVCGRHVLEDVVKNLAAND